MKKTLTTLLLIALGHAALSQDLRVRIGEVEFFGVNGYDTVRVRASLPSLAGREISEAEFTGLKTAIGDSVRQATGYAPTDVALVCCDARSMAIIYIGLRSQAAAGSFQYKPTPDESVRLPEAPVRLYEESIVIQIEAVEKNATEDHAKGYALSMYPPLRAKQLAFREYALGHAKLLSNVVLRSADAVQRAIAADLLGYARASTTQIKTLVSASRDPDERVRNNAIRALGVLAQSGLTIAKSIPAQSFIGMLNSGTWTDRNKGAFLLATLSVTRDPRLLHQLRLRALPALMEMARWRDRLHADNARTILGRVAGIPELRLLKLVAEGDVDQIVSTAQRLR